MRRFLALPWSEIGWSTVLANLILVVVCPVTLLLLASNPVTGAFLGAGAALLSVLYGALGGFIARILFDRLAPDQGLTLEVRWALALCVGLSAGFFAAGLGAFFNTLPNLLNLAGTNLLPGLLRQIAGWLEVSGSLFDAGSLIFPVGAALGMFWGWWGGGRRPI